MQKINNNLRHDKCPSCRSSKISFVGRIKYDFPLFYSTEEIELERIPELWKCYRCNSAFVQNAVSENDSKSLYTRGKAVDRWHHNTVFENSKPKIAVEIFTQYLAQGRRILDIGCNTGELLDFAKKKDCDTSGIEYSESSISLLKNKGHAAYSNFNQIDHSFDVITAFDLVEHLYSVPTFLDYCNAKLSLEGHLILLTGSINSLPAKISKSNWWYVKYPEHIVFPSKQYFKDLSQFHLVKWTSTYADVAYERPIKQVFKYAVKDILIGNYSGIYSFPDHAFIILKKNL
jgi:2-polyprenyl-3-methyl-5-hydroxy-6-metoxy-1,4-benzoquinol methylase